MVEVPAPLAERLRDGIEVAAGCACSLLRDEGRHPFQVFLLGTRGNVSFMIPEPLLPTTPDAQRLMFQTLGTLFAQDTGRLERIYLIRETDDARVLRVVGWSPGTGTEHLAYRVHRLGGLVVNIRGLRVPRLTSHDLVAALLRGAARARQARPE